MIRKSPSLSRDFGIGACPTSVAKGPRMGLKKSIHHLHVILKLTIISLPKMNASCRGNFVQADPSPGPLPYSDFRFLKIRTWKGNCVIRSRIRLHSTCHEAYYLPLALIGVRKSPTPRCGNKNGSKKDIHYLHVFFITLIITTLLKILIGCPGQLRRADPSPGPFSRLGVKGELRNSLPNSIAHNLP